jgi:hypothetical protein
MVMPAAMSALSKSRRPEGRSYTYTGNASLNLRASAQGKQFTGRWTAFAEPGRPKSFR